MLRMPVLLALAMAVAVATPAHAKGHGGGHGGHASASGHSTHAENGKKGKKGGLSVASGVYAGSFSGGDNGIIGVTLNTKGKFKGAAQSSDTGQTFTVKGSVNKHYVAKGKTSSGAVFLGTYQAEDNGQSLISGSWTNKRAGTGGTFTTTHDSAVAAAAP